jgi:hypothetical protein
VAGEEEGRQADEDRLAVQAGGGGGERDRADRHRQRVARDELAGRRLGHVEVAADLGQQSGDHELGQADAETAEREGRETKGGGGRRQITTPSICKVCTAFPASDTDTLFPFRYVSEYDL